MVAQITESSYTWAPISELPSSKYHAIIAVSSSSDKQVSVLESTIAIYIVLYPHFIYVSFVSYHIETLIKELIANKQNTLMCPLS